ncbi:N4-gp56 family major capsid protein [Paraburkholderia terrae]|uniref:N4-gp56 family major capsid protein n=1 Tax=Paraburkholderia terrae TaxID=311230 RepID=UPI001EE17019|nr:N4-gp56 family major capsid protein [Paraburkholderia terrae]GJH00220.1 N4-gp56 family major capsid protein [Paraburkholderia terrae]
MSQTVVPFGDVKAQKKWSANLAVDSAKKSYFEGKFIGTDDNSIIQRKTELETDAGDKVSFDLCVQMRGEPTYGDKRLKGKEEQLKFFTDEVAIDQVRKSASAGGRMTQKRTAHNLRQVARDRLGDYFGRLVDEILFMYLSASRGVNADFIESLAYTGFANNPFNAPDVDHIMYGGVATSKASLATTDTMSRVLIERAQVKANMMQAMNPDTANMVPVSIEGTEDRYVCLMSPFQEFQLRTQDAAGWLEIQKAAAAAEGRNNPIFKGGLGMIGNTILHSHRNVIRFSDYGAGANLPAARALFMGRQAAVIAYGSKGGLRYTWKEEMEDYDNEPTVASGFIGGVKKTQFNGKDFGVISIDTYAKDPNT